MQRAKDWTATLLMFAMPPILIFMMAGATLAARPDSRVWINELGAGARGALALGEHFSVGYATREREPFALVQCWPDGTTVHSGTYPDGTIWAAVFSVYPGGPTPQDFTLGESVYPVWTDGGASCSVSLVTYSRDLSRQTVHATTGFSASP